MALWVRNGTVTVTNGSASVVGSGTTWSDNRDVIPGHAFRGPDGKSYEVLSIESNTGLTLAEVYTGATLAGQAYAILPVPYAFAAELIAHANTLITRLTNTVSIPALLVGSPSITVGVVAAFKGIRSVFESATSVAVDVVKAAATDYATLRFFSGAQSRYEVQLDNQNAVRHNYHDGTGYKLPFFIPVTGHPQFPEGVNFPNLLTPPAGYGDGSFWQQGSKLKVRQAGVTKNLFRTENAGFRNLLMNPRFVINQRAVSGTVTLAAGAYGHDGVKAGASGATYTFAGSGADIFLVVSAGSIILPVEAINLGPTGIYTLSWEGSAQARVWQGTGHTGSGSYGASPAQPTLITLTQTNAEFGVGVVYHPQLEVGDEVSSFERRPSYYDFDWCQRYFQRSNGWVVPMVSPYAAGAQGYVNLPTQMRSTPTSFFAGSASLYGPSVGAPANVTSSNLALLDATAGSVTVVFSSGGPSGSAGVPMFLFAYNTISLSAEL